MELKTKPISLRFGRRLYYFQYQEQLYWLKMQMKQGHHIYQQGFQHELAFYQESLNSTSLSSIILPCEIVSKAFIASRAVDIEIEQSLAQMLILPHAVPYFTVSARTLPIASIQDYLLRALDVIQGLHETGWIHADLKPEHFVEYQGQVKLIDFEQVQSMTQQVKTEMNATPRYMAPELFHGEVKTIQTDIYALGIIFYEWLSGQRLSAKNYTDWAYLHCQRLQIELPEKFLGFQSLLLKMLAKHKEARFDNIYAIKQALVSEIA
ncbi:serine/threonine protein kinase [Acinetobacter sp. ANC 4173]|uniref:serine/threonine protein kinase n=1 Tax=Acinetobacter sp. ANC 4173 TaxID=2529837 RepID=UPI001D0D91A9|nr:protein kinase [Acinetobacter sp. ANC 4173]